MSTDKEKALLILNESKKEFKNCEKQFKELAKRLDDVSSALEYANTLLKRVLNESEHLNIHKDCKYYHEDTDCCHNYLMGCYTGLAFEVSRHEKCIEDIIKDSEDE